MRGNLLPYVLFILSMVVFGYLLRGAGVAGQTAALALALLVWWWAARRFDRDKA